MWHGFHPFGLIFPILFLVFVLTRILFFRRRGCHRWAGGELPAEELLKRRLVNGEIGEEEYLRVREVLKRK